MLASYMWSRTIVPTHGHVSAERCEDEYTPKSTWAKNRDFSGAISRNLSTGSNSFAKATATRCVGALDTPDCFRVLFSGVLRAFHAVWSSSLGRDFFPTVDAGQIRLHFRARTGLRIEETARLADQVDEAIRETIPQEELETVLDNIGVPYSGINLSYSNAGTIWHVRCRNSGATEERTWESRPANTSTNCASKLPQTFPGVQFFFQPADIVTQILEFRDAGAHRRRHHRREPARQLSGGGKSCGKQLRHIPGAVDVHVQQAFDAANAAHGYRSHARSIRRHCRPGTWRKTCWSR